MIPYNTWSFIDIVGETHFMADVLEENKTKIEISPSKDLQKSLRTTWQTSPQSFDLT